MRTRKWVLVLAVICTIVFLAIYHGWKLFKANEKIKDYLLVKIRPILSDDLSIEKLEMGLGKVHLKGIHLESPDGSISLWIEDLRLSYSLVSLIRHGFDPTTMDEILLIQPRLTIIKSRPQEKALPQINIDEFLATAFSDKDQIKNLDFIKRITLSKGTIVYIDSTNTKIQFAHDIDGWINSTDFNNAFASLKGKLFSSKTNNIKIEGKLNLTEVELLGLSVIVSNYKMTEGLPFLIPDYLQITSGLLDGRITIAKKELQTLEYSSSGNLNIVNGGFRFADRNLYFDKIMLSADVKDWQVFVNKANLNMNGSWFTMECQTLDLLNPQIDLLFRSDSLDVGMFAQVLAPDLPLSTKGLASVTIHSQGSFINPKIQVSFRCHALTINDNISIDSLHGHLTFSDSVLYLDELNAIVFNDSLQGMGSFNLFNPADGINFSFAMKGNIGDSLFISAEEFFQPYPFQLAFNFSKTLSQPKANGEFSLDLKSGNEPHFSLTGNLEFERDTLQLKANSPDSQFSISGEFFDLFKKPMFNFQFKNLQKPLLTLTKFPFQKQLINRNLLNLQVKGNLDEFDLSTEIIKRDHTKLLFLSGKVSRNDSTQRMRGELRLSPDPNVQLITQFSFVKTGNFIIIEQFKMDDFLRGSGKLSIAGQEDSRAKIDILGAEIKELYYLLTFSKLPSDLEGQFWGKIDVKGSLQMPHVGGYLALDNGIFNKIGTYKSELSFNFENNVLTIYDLYVKKDSRRLLHGNGFLNNQTKAMNFSLSGQEIDFNQLSQLIINEKEFIAGHGAIDLRLHNTLESPQIDADIRLSNGSLFGFRFDSVSCTLGKGANQEQSEWTHPTKPHSALELSELVFTRNDEFTITANGFFPYSSEEPFEFKLDADGNLLAILPEISAFFVETASQGHLSLQIGGTQDEPLINKAHYKFHDGSLRLRSVVKKVENVYGVINYDPESDFVHIQKLVGFVKNDSLLITNIKEAPKRLRNTLKPFIADIWGLNFGIFVLKTNEKGLKLNIPGLMEKGELGRIQLLGKYPNEVVYVAGPWEKPVIRGEVRLRDFNITYPFITTDTDSESIVSRFLERTEWDLRVIPMKDTRYVTTIPGAPDNVYINMVLNNDGKGLNFTGIVEDESFGIDGKIESNRGRVEYLDFNFRIEQAGAEFDRVMLDPLVYGRARTAIFDSTGQTFNLWLTLYLIDRETGEKRPLGRWEDNNLYFEISSDNPNLGSTNGQILSNLGYSVEHVRTKGPDIIGISADNLFFKPLFRPVERRLERMFNLDFVQLSSRFTRNFLARNLSQNSHELSKYALLKSTRLTVGKYLADRLFFLYTGEVNTTMHYQPEQPEIGLRHTFGLEYRILPNLMIEMEYDYNNLLLDEKEDKKIMLRHSFPF